MDPTGAIIPGAEVRLVYPSGKVARSTRSEGDGTFTFSAVAPGDYTLRIHIRGFASRSQKIVVAHGQPISANIELQVAGGTEVVNVVAEAVYSESVASTATRTSVPLPRPSKSSTRNSSAPRLPVPSRTPSATWQA
jgi:hypothetical protein